MSTAPFSYSPAGLTKSLPNGGAPSGFVVDHNRVRLGAGLAAFERARAAVQSWEMFHLGWVQLCWPSAPISVNTTVAILVRRFGAWLSNACRIVYTVEETGDLHRFGFAYGTLPDHVESGEERFTVEWNRSDDSVWYDLLAVSRPHHILARLGFPYARHLQRRFASDSLRAMQRASEA
jgi:uncharacterized protein (UPF0548 family)